MEYNPSEIDDIDTSTCPYNPNHRFDPDKFSPHIVRCQDANRLKDSIRVKRCPHNDLHVFMDEAAYRYHLPRCASDYRRPKSYPANFGEAARKIEYLKCPFNPNHRVLPEAMANHIENCPNKHKKRDPKRELSEIEERAVDITPIGYRNRCHGHLATSELRESQPTQRVKMSNGADSYSIGYQRARSITIHYSTNSFDVLKAELPDRSLPESDLYLDRLTFANYLEWPGLKQIHDNRMYGEYLVATLHKDDLDETSCKMYDKFVTYLSRNIERTLKIATCTQAAGSDNVMYMVVYKDEQGFGNHIYQADLGVFCFPHSVLYNRPNKLDELNGILGETRENLRKMTEEASRVSLIESEKELIKGRMIQLEREKIDQEIAFRDQYEMAKQEFQRRGVELQRCLKEASEHYSAQLKKEQDEYDRKAHDINIAINQLQSDFQSAQQQHENEMIKAEETTNMYIEAYQSEQQHVKSLERELLDERHKNAALMNRLESVRDRPSNVVNQVSIQEIRTKVEAEMKERIEAEVREKMMYDLQEKELCSFCMQEKKNTVFVPCGHMLYCNLCANEMGIPMNKKLRRHNDDHECEICKVKVKKAVQAFAF
jgi:hypothetical protein